MLVPSVIDAAIPVVGRHGDCGLSASNRGSGWLDHWSDDHAALKQRLQPVAHGVCVVACAAGDVVGHVLLGEIIVILC